MMFSLCCRCGCRRSGCGVSRLRWLMPPRFLWSPYQSCSPQMLRMRLLVWLMPSPLRCIHCRRFRCPDLPMSAPVHACPGGGGIPRCLHARRQLLPPSPSKRRSASGRTRRARHAPRKSSHSGCPALNHQVSVITPACTKFLPP